MGFSPIHQRNFIKSRRDGLKIIIDILNISIDPAVKTKILYGANLNYKILKKYLDLLQEKRLIEKRKVNNTTYYKTTDTGKAFLKHYNKLQKIIKIDIDPPTESIVARAT